MEKNLGPERIRYEYEKDHNAKPHYAHGVWGGINQQGEVELNFYTESDTIPAFTECILGPDGLLGPEEAGTDAKVKVLTRHVHSRVILNYYTAKAVLEWLQDQVDFLEDEKGRNGFFYENASGKEQ